MHGGHASLSVCRLVSVVTGPKFRMASNPCLLVSVITGPKNRLDNNFREFSRNLEVKCDIDQGQVTWVKVSLKVLILSGGLIPTSGCFFFFSDLHLSYA